MACDWGPGTGDWALKIVLTTCRMNEKMPMPTHVERSTCDAMDVYTIGIARQNPLWYCSVA
jgi:hypothetical protein